MAHCNLWDFDQFSGLGDDLLYDMQTGHHRCDKRDWALPFQLRIHLLFAHGACSYGMLDKAVHF